MYTIYERISMNAEKNVCSFFLRRGTHFSLAHNCERQPFYLPSAVITFHEVGIVGGWLDLLAPHLP